MKFKTFYKIFLKGLIGVLPLTLSVYVVVWFVHSFTAFTDELISYVIPSLKGVTGVGLLVGALIIFLLGLLFSNKKFSEVFSIVQFPFKNIPFIKSVYSAVEDMMFYFSSDEKNKKGKVVFVKIPNTEIRLMGLLTNEDFSDLEKIHFDQKMVTVFIPMSYALGGYTIFVPAQNVELTNLGVDFAMKSALTAWMKKQNSVEH